MVSTNHTLTPNDWLVGITVDANGNTTAPAKIVDDYDFKKRLISSLGGGQQMSLVYDDGNRLRKSVNGRTTLCVVCDGPSLRPPARKP